LLVLLCCPQMRPMHWRRLQGFELIPKVVTTVRFVDGEEQTQQAA